MAGSPVVSIYRSGSTTESTAGVVLTQAFDTHVGLHHVSVDTSADSFYTRAGDYFAILTAGTVDGVTIVGRVIGQFSIENRGHGDRSLLQSTSINVLSSQTSFTLSEGSADNDAYNNATIIIKDATTPTQKAWTKVLDYVGSTKTIKLSYLG